MFSLNANILIENGLKYMYPSIIPQISYKGILWKYSIQKIKKSKLGFIASDHER